jgi:flagellar L-ring protein precursor FlgH
MTTHFSPKALAAGLLLLAGHFAAGESLYREDGFRSMVADVKAYRPGDSLTVVIVENASAQSSTDTSSTRDQALGFDLAFSPTPTSRSAAVKTNNDFDNQGSTQRTGKFLAQITVTVLDVAANGELRVSGQQMLEINNEKQHIRLEGRVRPYDISGNSVLSTRLADAKISYLGDGDLADRQRPGWWVRLLTWLGF